MPLIFLKSKVILFYMSDYIKNSNMDKRIQGNCLVIARELKHLEITVVLSKFASK